MSGDVVLSDRIQPVGKACLRKTGKDVAIVAWGTMVRVALDAAERLGREGIAASVLDLRWLSPLDTDALRDTVAAADGRVVIAHEANLTGGFGAEIVARLHELLEGTPLRVRR